jgi:hypothetical protein
MSSLIPERPIVISASLATTIGLEEAVLLQVLNDAVTFAEGRETQGYHWHKLSYSELQNLLPFWDQQTLQRVSHSLRDKGIILLESTALQPSDYLAFAMNETPTTSPSPALKKPAVAAQTPLQPARAGSAARVLADDWQPDEDLLQLLALNHTIPRAFALQQREDFVLYWRDRQQVSHSWPSKFRQHVLREWRFQQSREATSAQQQLQTNDINGAWQPSDDALDILYRAGISRDFIEDAIPEFVLYWRERGEAHSTWNSKFIAHIRRQWAKFTKTVEMDYEPREIAANWQPSEDVYDILKLANIDHDFARQLVPEFVLFWRDTQQIQRSWNTKFLQHVKYQWATRHHMENRYARQSIAHQPAGATHEFKHSPFKQLTDRSWAAGIVEGI